MTAYPTTARPHPLILIAAASVILVSFAGMASIAGWLPSPMASAATTSNSPIPATTATSAEPAKPIPASTRPLVRKTLEKPAMTPAGENKALVDLIPANPVAVADATPQSQISSPACLDCGLIDSINEIQTPASGTGGAVVGGLVGGLLGNQVGKGSTRDIATLIGIAGGALAGRKIEQTTNTTQRYDTIVVLEDGSRRTFSSDIRPTWRIGEKVRIQNGELAARP